MPTRRQQEQELIYISRLVDDTRTLVAKAQRDLSMAENRQRILVEALAPKQDGKVGISDHALVRYLEHRFKLDMVALKAEILTPIRVAAIKAGTNRIKVGGLKFIVKDNTVVTVID